VTSAGHCAGGCREPLLTLTKEGSFDTGTNFTTGRISLDLGDTVVYRITIDHSPISLTSVNAMRLIDTLRPMSNFWAHGHNRIFRTERPVPC